MQAPELANVAWHALNGTQRTFTVGNDRARRYAHGFAPIAAVADPSRPDFESLRSLAVPGERLYIAGLSTDGDLPGWKRVDLTQVVQMVGPVDPHAPPAAPYEVRLLGPEHLDEMAELVANARPGPWGPRSMELGSYVGVFAQGRLLSMAGTRMASGPWVEISAVCTLPQASGRGLARLALQHLLHRLAAEGRSPFLHVDHSNHRALALYRRLGFSEVSRQTLLVLERRPSGSAWISAGLAVHARIDSVASSKKVAPITVVLPAMGVPASFYDRFAPALAHATSGSVWLVDLPGHGASALRACRGDDYGYHELVTQALPSLVSHARDEHPGRPLYVLGHSIGGQLAVLASGRLQGMVAGLILVASGSAHHRAWPPHLRLRALLVTIGVTIASRLLPWYPGQRLGFGGNQARRWMRDWSHNALNGVYRLHRPDGAAEPAQTTSARLPVLAIQVDQDALAPPSALDELMRLLPHAQVRRELIAAMPGHSPWRRHFSWARDPQDVVRLCSQWMGWCRLSDSNG